MADTPTKLSRLLVQAVANAKTLAAVAFKAAAGQTGDLLQFQNSSGTVLSKVDKDGKFLGPAAGVALSNLARGTNGQLIIGQTGADPAWTGVTGDVTIAATGVTTLDAGIVRIATVSLTSAQVKALRGTPITLVAAPGAGKVLRFWHATLFLKYGTNAFTESTCNLAVKYNNGSGVQVSQTMEMTGFIDQTADTMTNGEAKIDGIVASASADNQALVLHNIGAGEIAGNAANDGTLTLMVAYRVATRP